MNTVDLRFGIPNIEIGCPSGAKINPSTFAGHELIVLFCPLDADRAGKEIGAYLSHSDEFVAHDAWLLTFAEHWNDLAIDGGSRILAIPDRECRAWAAFRDLAWRGESMHRDSGATFLFTRGGSLHHYWPGTGHVDEVLAELVKPSFEHPHQIAY